MKSGVSFFVLSVSLLFLGCGKKRNDNAVPLPEFTAQAEAQPRHSAAPNLAGPAPSTSERSEPNQAAPSATAEGTIDASNGSAAVHTHYIVDSLVDIAQAGPAAASASGVVMITADERVVIAELGKRSSALQSRPSPLTPLSSALSFRVARAPTVSAEHVFWIGRSGLMRASLKPPRDAQLLASDARPGTRVASAGPLTSRSPASGVPRQLPEAVAYIANDTQRSDALIARMWLAQDAPLTLSPEGAAANSVSMVATARGYVVASLEGRTSMTPVHAREVRFDTKARPELLEDHVVWVGGASQPLTELFLTRHGAHDFLALVAMEQDATHFGLLTLRLGPKLESAQPRWSLYANGIDPAPLAVAELCGHSVIVRARPEGAELRALQSLELLSLATAEASSPPTAGAPLQATGKAPFLPLILAHARAFFDVSLAAIPGGALLVYVADRRTFARTLRCRK